MDYPTLDHKELYVLSASAINVHVEALSKIIFMSPSNIYKTRDSIRLKLGEAESWEVGLCRAQVLGLLPQHCLLPYIPRPLLRQYRPDLLPQRYPLPKWAEMKK